MNKFYISDVVKAFEVMRHLRDLHGQSVPEGEDDPLYPNWVRALELSLADMTTAYVDTVRAINEFSENS